MSETQTVRPQRMVLGIWVLPVLCAAVLGLWILNWVLLVRYGGSPQDRGQFGDMFGAVNALFTALAFAGLIYTVFLQRKQLDLQQQEITESAETQRQLVDDQIAAQERLFEAQKAHADDLQKQRREFDALVEDRRKARQAEDDDHFRKNVLRAIRFELDALDELYEGAIGKELAAVEDGKPLMKRAAFSQNYCAVFEASAVHLGKIEAAQSNHIIKAYALLKCLIENFGINNEYLNQLELIAAGMEADPDAPATSVEVLTRSVVRGLRFGKKRLALERRMIEQAGVLRDVETKLKVEVASLRELLDREGIR